MNPDEISTTLKKCELFRALDDRELDRLAGLCTVEALRAGETVYDQGQSGDRLWIVSKGQVSLLRKYKLTGSRTADALRDGLRSPLTPCPPLHHGSSSGRSGNALPTTLALYSKRSPPSNRAPRETASAAWIRSCREAG